jgi:cystathionine beta-lyase/cystathionine gamma-synthase
LREYKERSRKRRELLRRLWRLSDLIGEEKVEELLKNFEESLERGSGAKI